MLTDKSRFTFDFLGVRRRNWRVAGDRFTNSTRGAHDKYETGSVLVWGRVPMT